jgi:hypothetical protein
MTAVKMMSFGVPLGCEDPVLTRHQALSSSAKISSFLWCSSFDGSFFQDPAFCLIAELGKMLKNNTIFHFMRKKVKKSIFTNI